MVGEGVKAESRPDRASAFALFSQLLALYVAESALWSTSSSPRPSSLLGPIAPAHK